MQSPLPLRRHPLVATSNFDEAKATYEKLAAPIDLERLDRRAPFGWRSNRLSVGPLAVAVHQYGAALRATAPRPPDVFAVSFPLSDVRGEAWEVSAITGARSGASLARGRETFVSSPVEPQTFRLGTGYRALQLLVDQSAMHGALAALTGVTAKERIRFEPRLSLARGAGAALERLTSFFVREVDHPNEGFFATPMLAARFSDLVVSLLLLNVPHNYTARLAKVGRPAEPRYVRLAAEHLEAHAAEPVQMTNLAKIVGVSVRALQLGFRRHRGQNPTDFLRDRRLDLAHALLQRDDLASVGDIARRCGFENAGRFSARYRARFGELPSTSRRRR